ncbi:MAG: tyrosine--tRNA ligase [Chlamydia sp.]
MNSLITILSERGLLDAVTHPALTSVIEKKGIVKVYCGFDPTAKSLHVGNLVALIVLSWFRKLGHDIVVLIGGATGMIGDPSGKSRERLLLDEETLLGNIKNITNQINAILSRVPGSGSIEIVNNRDWYQGISCIDFLRDIGKEFRLGQMLAKESVKSRLQSEEGMSYTEFSYQVLQGYDFFHLFSKKNTLIQIGGSDQWGNITAGIEHIRKVMGEEAYGITFPLLLKQDGQKFGKSEKGALWLSAELLSEYELYQYFMRLSDDDAVRLLKVLTFIHVEEIEQLKASMKSECYIPNSIQKRLAKAVVAFVHGDAAVCHAEEMTSVLQPGQDIAYTEESIALLSQSLTSIRLSPEKSIGMKLIDILADSKVIESKSEVRRLIKNQGISINGIKITSQDLQLEESYLIGGIYFVITVGKKQRFLMEMQ